MELRSCLNQSVRLVFADGEVVDAILLGADETRDMDLTYEIVRIVTGSRSARGSAVGATCVAALSELASWTPRSA